jgi:Subtilase family
MRTPRADRRIVLLLVAAVATGAALTASAGSGSGAKAWPAGGRGSWSGLLAARPSVVLPPRSIVVLRTPSLAERVRRAGGHATAAQEKRWTGEALAAQEALVARLAAAGIALKPELRFARVLDGFSALVSPAAAALLERDRDVAGVYPVRVAYPAADAASVIGGPAFAAGSGHRVPAPPRGLDGRGVTVALLDTHVDASVAYLHGAVLHELDVVGGTSGIGERHGTELAGLVAGRDGPGGLAGAAPGARVLPIRVAGLQRETNGAEAVFARSDQIVAGLDRAVDPNGDGDAHDAVRVALLALSEPFAGFADSPESRAIAGAQALDTLVVVAAGNDGPGGDRYGDLSGPAGASDALTVGALDTRPSLEQAAVALHAGGTTYRGSAPLAGPVPPSQKLETLLGLAHGRIATAAGNAVVVTPSVPQAPGGLPLGRRALPALALPATVAAALRRALSAGSRASLSLAPAPPTANPDANRPAPFSSTGPDFAGDPKPELLAPGVALATSDPNAPGGSARWTTVSGTSAAAAAVAGDAAVLAQARPDLDARALRAVLADSASAGTRAASAATAVRAAIVAEPATLTLRDGRAEVAFTNVSDAAVQLGLAAVSAGGTATLSVRSLDLAPDATATVRIDVAAGTTGSGVLAGTLVATPVGGGPVVRVPWLLRQPAKPVPLLGSVSLSTHVFAVGDPTPAVLSVDAGRVLAPGSRPDIRALARLDVELVRGGERLGLLARLRDVLPGRYTFGLTARGPGGRPLKPGDYAVLVVATPVDGASPTRRTLRFSLR